MLFNEKKGIIFNVFKNVFQNILKRFVKYFFPDWVTASPAVDETDKIVFYLFSLVWVLSSVFHVFDRIYMK